MTTTDIAFKVDPAYRAVCEKFLGDFDAFTQAFSKAWYKLTHRDMGPRERYPGAEKVNENDLLWQDPIPVADYATYRRGRHCSAEAVDSGFGCFGFWPRVHGFFGGGCAPQQRQARRC
ncbi:hypothetical protein [Hymenobacter caeli]